MEIAEEVATFFQAHDVDGAIERMPEAWVDALSAAGTPEQVTDALQRLIEAGANSILFQPLDADPDCHLQAVLRFYREPSWTFPAKNAM